MDVDYPEHQHTERQKEFTTNDWDSDIEDSNSSEEFVYTKESTELYEYLHNRSNREPSESNDDLASEENEHNATVSTEPINEKPASSHNDDDQRSTNDEQSDIQEIWNVWNSHEDLIAVSTNGMDVNQ